MKDIQLDFESLTALRQELHAHPETAGEEAQTAQRIAVYLDQYKPDQIITELGGHGVAAVFNGKSPGKRVMVRAELDALPIAELNEDIDYKSVYAGKSHKCGHDGHMSMVAGLAQIYGKDRPARGEVVLLFQPAEETGQGARAVCTDARFENIRPDYALSLHNIPGEEMGTILCKEGAFSSSVESIIVKISGRTSHAAEPEEALSAGEVMAPILSRAYAYEKTDAADENFKRIAVTGIFSGSKSAYGTTAGDGEIHFTLRARTPEKFEELRSEFKTMVEQEVAAMDKGGLSVEFVEGIEPFMANVNDPDAVKLVQQAAAANGLAYVTLKTPYPWGEDFGYFTNLPDVKGVMFGLGSGKDTPVLHDPHFDFPDALIPKGVGMFHQMIESLDHDA